MQARWPLALALSAAIVLVAAADDEQLLKDNRVATDAPGLLAFIRERTTSAVDGDKIKALIRQLGDDEFARREEASQRLLAIGSRARGALLKAVNDSDVEVSRRAQDCLRRLDQTHNAEVVAAAVRRIGQLRPDGACGVLLAYLPAAEDDAIGEDARKALESVAVRDGKADPALLAALTDPSAVKRAAAAVILSRPDLPDHRAAVRKLLADADPIVRLRIGLALTRLREKDAIPVLIDTLDRLGPFDREVVEDVLARLADEKAPSVLPGGDDAGRKRYVDAWHAWWREQGSKVDPARLEEAAKWHGHTLVVLLDDGKAIDLDERNAPRWEIDGLDRPLDVQLLSGDRLLTAEHKGDRVTERNRKKEILWEKKIEGPLAAQRLSNGNTFIATKTQLVEFDRAGRQVFTYSRPGGEQFQKAHRLRNGDIAMVVQLPIGSSRFIRLDPGGKELQSFPVELRTSGGRIDVLPDGNVLVPELAQNRVVELDKSGKVVWEATVDQPVAAIRLPNGNTLVTSMNTNRAVEINRAGREVWHYRGASRVTRALRR